MKTLTVTQAKSKLGKLVDAVHAGQPIILVHNEKLVKVERYEPFDPEAGSPELEAMLLQAVTGPHTPYSKKDLEAVAAKVKRELRRK
jgi:prevent-host-death family protein